VFFAVIISHLKCKKINRGVERETDRQTDRQTDRHTKPPQVIGKEVYSQTLKIKYSLLMMASFKLEY